MRLLCSQAQPASCSCSSLLRFATNAFSEILQAKNSSVAHLHGCLASTSTYLPPYMALHSMDYYSKARLIDDLPIEIQNMMVRHVAGAGSGKGIVGGAWFC